MYPQIPTLTTIMSRVIPRIERSIFYIMVALLVSITSQAQQINGNYAVVQGSTTTYSVTDVDYGANWSFSITGGTLTSSTKTSTGIEGPAMAPATKNTATANSNPPPGGGGTYTYVATVHWGTGTSGNVGFNGNGLRLYNFPTILCPSTVAAPTGITFSISYCGTITISYSGTPPTNVRWYWQTSATGTSVANSGTSMTSSVSGNFYLRAETYCGTWSSSSLAVNGNNGLVNVVPVPSVPSSVTGSYVCGGGTATMSATPGTNGNNIYWYSASSGGSALASGTSYTIPSPIYSTTTYYTSSFQSGTVCESTGARVPVTITEYVVPTVSITGAGTVCNNASVSLTVGSTNATSVSWSATGSNANIPTPSGTGSTISEVLSVVSTAQYGNVTFTATANNGPCAAATPASKLVYIVVPPSVNLGDKSICSGQNTSLSVSTPSLTCDYYSWTVQSTSNITGAANGNTQGTFIDGQYTIQQTLANSTSAQGNVLYTVTPSAYGCAGTPSSATVYVNQIPNAAVSAGYNTICSAGITRLTMTNPNGVSNTILTWTATPTGTATGYSGGSGSTGVFTDQALSTGNTASSVNYVVTPSASGCTGGTVNTTVTINPVPVASVSISPSSATVCSGSSATLSFINQNNVSGTLFSYTQVANNSVLPFDNESGTNISGNFYNQDGANQGSGVFTITPYTANCTGAPVTATVYVNPAPMAPTPATFLTYGGNAVTLQVTVPPNAQAQWYADNVTSTVLSSNPTYPITATGNTFQTYYVSLKSLTAPYCETSRAAMTGTFVALIAPASMTREVLRITGQTTEDQVIQLNTTQKAVTVSFMDGLSRTNQVLALNATATGKDLVQPVEYNSFGRSAKSYLPYSATTSGTFQNNYTTEQPKFYTAATGPQKVAYDANPFAVSGYEQSPMGRLLEQGGSGQAWQPGTQHTQRMTYSYNTGDTNNDKEEVRKFASDGSSTGYYAVNTLTRVSSQDGNGNFTIVFTNGSGKTVARKQQSGTNTWLQTYYVYDDLNRLKYIIPPAGLVALKANGWVLSTTILNDHLHQFVYDNRGRLLQKKTPGQAWSYFCYDNLNRLVLSQDGNQRPQNKWAFVKYDINGRAVMSGLYTNATVTGQAAMQTLLTGYTPQYEKKGGTLYGYTNTGFPTVNADNSALEIWSVNYYDDYSFTFNNGTSPVYDNAHLAGLKPKATAFTRGRATGSRKLIVGTSNWIVSAVFYDDYGHVVQTQGNNHLYLNGLDKGSTVYDFEKATQTKMTHSPDGTNITTIVQTPVFDTQGRVYQMKHSINGAADQIVAQYEYNELGQVVDKKLHVNGSSFLQSVDYRYNIKGWLTSINNAQLASDANVTNDEVNDYFGLEMLYNTTQTGLNDQAGDNVYYNGNVSAIKWKGAGAVSGTAGQSSYKFNYDNADKLLTAKFQKYGTSAWNAEANTLDEAMTYDVNGNIKTLTRNHNLRGLSGTTVTSTPEAIDNLTYTYLNNANCLTKVDDAAPAAASAAGFANGTNSGDDYAYDPTGNGNLISDLNKGISNIAYNAVGKPTQITFSTAGKGVSYTYDGAGNKLSMTSTTTVNAVTTTTTTDYVNGFVYNTTSSVRTLAFFSSPEGRVIKNGSSYEYQYAIADHQGNTRVVFTSATPTVDVKTATFETANQTTEATQFSNYGHITAGHATSMPGNSQYLNGNASGMVGVARSYKVYPGDQLKIEAYGSYNSVGGSSSLASFAGAILAAFNLSAPAPGEVGTPSAALNTWGATEAGGYADGTTDNTDPKAFVNIVLFDKDYKFLDVAYAQLKGTSLYYMSQTYTVKEAGYAYLYVSNEQAVQTDVYFDDVKMTYTPTNIIQSSEYYPFGLQTERSWTRTGTTNNFLYNEGSELNNVSGMYDLPFRNYDAALGRFFQVDPLALLSHTMTPYHYAGNNPISYNDPWGLDKERDKQKEEEEKPSDQGGPGGSGEVDEEGYDDDHDGIADWAEEREDQVNAMYGYGGGRYGNTLGRWVKTTSTTEGREVELDFTTGHETVWEEGITTTSYEYEYDMDYDPDASFNPFDGGNGGSGRPSPIDIFDSNKTNVIRGILSHMSYIGHNPDEQHNLSDIVKTFKEPVPWWKGWIPSLGSSNSQGGTGKIYGADIQWFIGVAGNPNSDSWKTSPANMNLEMNARSFTSRSFIDNAVTTIYQITVWGGSGDDKLIYINFLSKDAWDKTYNYLKK